MALTPEAPPGFTTLPAQWPGASTNPGAATPATQGQIEAWRHQFIETILHQVVLAFTNVFLPGISSFDQLRDWALSLPVISNIVQIIKDLTGIDLLTVFDGIDITNPGAVLEAITSVGAGMVQAVIDAIVTGLTGVTSTGNDALAVLFGILGQTAAVPFTIIDQLFGAIAALTGQHTSAQNNSGVTLTDVFPTTGVGGWTNLVGTLALNSAGVAQTSSVAVARRNTAPSSDRQFAQVTVDSMMRGACRVGICSSTTADNYAALELYSGFSGDAARIVTGSSPTLAVVQKQADYLDPRTVNNSVWEIWYDPTPNTYRVLRNGQPALEWVDSSNIVTHGAGKRNTILVTNAYNDSRLGSYGPGVRQVTVGNKS